MPERVFTVQYITSKNCFCYVSTSIRDIIPGQPVKISFNDNKHAYFSLGPPLSNLPDYAIGINTRFAKALGIGENDSVILSEIREVPSIKKLSISLTNQSDYDVLELLADNIQLTLLDRIKVLGVHQPFIIWIGDSLFLKVFVDDIEPISPGYLDNLTEIEVKTPAGASLKQLQNAPAGDIRGQAEDIRGQAAHNDGDFGHKFDLLDLLKGVRPSRDRANVQGGAPPSTLVLRLVPFSSMKVPKSLEVYFQPWTVFVPRRTYQRSLGGKQLYKLNILNRQDQEVNDKTFYAQVYILEDHLKQYEGGNLPKDNCYVHDDLLEYFNCDFGSRVTLTSSARKYNVNEVVIHARKNFLIDYVETMKRYLANICEYHQVILNAGIVMKLGQNTNCNVTFLPTEAKFCLLDKDALRNIKFSLSHDDFIALKEKNVCEDLRYVDDVANYGDIIRECSLLYEHYLEDSHFENVIVIGKPGVGKTSLLKQLALALKRDLLLYTHKVSCKTLKGKTPDSLHKLLSATFDDLVYHQPSVLLLDDIHILCEQVNDGDALTQNALYFNRVSEMMYNMIHFYGKHNQIGVIASTDGIEKLNRNIYTSRGGHLFKNVFVIDNLTTVDRTKLLECLFQKYKTSFNFANLSLKLDGFVVQDIVDFTKKSIFQALKRPQDQNTNVLVITEDDVEVALKKSDILSLQDVKLHSPGTKDFSDIGGLEDVKKTLVEVLLWPLKYPTLFSNSPLRLQSGLLLYGPPGTGKTLLAGAAAKQFGLRLISIKGPELLSKYIGASEQAVRDVFQKAQNAKPCILFFDEFDSLAPRRGHDNTGVTDRVVNQLLTQLDGVESLSGVSVLAATSRPDLLDPALLRPGRLDKQIFCSLPDQNSRLEIFRALSKSMDLANDVALEELAAKTEGYSGADIQAVLYTAQLSAVEKLMAEDKKHLVPQPISQRHLEDALKKTRPSLTRDERLRYERIYFKFQDGGFQEVPPGSKATLA